MDSTTPRKIGFRFDGGLADRAELDLYEAGRHRYAAARLILTLEGFRQDGLVRQRLSSRVPADFRIKAAAPGSFFDGILIYAAPILADGYLKVPFEKVLGWALDRLLPKSNQGDRLVNLAEKAITTMQEREKTEQQREVTERERIAFQRDQLQLIAELVKRDDIQARDRVQKIAEGIDQATLTAVGDEVGTLKYGLDEWVGEKNRRNEITDYEKTLSEVVTPEAEQKIISRVRRIMPEVAFPLRGSAVQMEVTTENDNLPIAVVNSQRINQINVFEDLGVVELVGNITRFDKKTLYGRIEIEGERRPLTFRMDREALISEREKTIEAMKKSRIRALFVPRVDGSGATISLRLKQIIE